MKLRLRKKVKEKLICTMFLLKLTQSKIVFGKKILFWYFHQKRAKSHASKPLSQKIAIFFGWILAANFQILMCFLWTKSTFMPKYGRKYANKCQKKFSRKRWFWVMTPQKSKNFKNLQVCRHFFLGSKKFEWSHMLFYIVQHVYFKIKTSPGCAIEYFGWKRTTKMAF